MRLKTGYNRKFLSTGVSRAQKRRVLNNQTIMMCTINDYIFNKLWGQTAIYKCEIRKATIL